MDVKYYPEIHNTPLLEDDMASKYCSVIGSLNWIITLGQFDVHCATNVLSRYSMAPRQGHLDAAFRVLSYLKQCPQGRILIDTSLPLSKLTTEEVNWREQYPDAEEKLPPNMPQPQGRPVRITAYVDAEHAHDLVT